jgi:exopolysaccharide production protein ExoZ
MSKTTSWNLGIQILRGLAAVLVVFHHSLEESLAISQRIAPEWLIRLGASGVDIFFVISGFIIFSVTYGRDPRNPEPAPLFLTKRFVRIFPIYWICLLGTLALFLTGHFYRSLHLDAGILGSSVFLLPNKKLIVGVAWTLVYEMYFYYLFSITLYIRNARLSTIVTTTFICAGLFLSRFLPAGDYKQFLSDPIAVEFCFGLILAYFIHRQALNAVWLRYLWLPGLILMVAGSAFAWNNGSTAGIAAEVRFLAWGLPALLVTFSFIKMRFAKSSLTRILVPVGDASYSIYLTHPTMMIVFASLINSHILKPIPYPIFYTLLFTVICIIFGLLIHYLVERPILAWLRSRLQVKRSARLAPSEKGASEASLMDPGAERELILGAEKPL